MANTKEEGASIAGKDDNSPYPSHSTSFHSNTSHSRNTVENGMALLDVQSLKDQGSLNKDGSLMHFTDKVADQILTSGGVQLIEVKNGIGWVVAAMFILGDLVGGGVVAMPAGFVETGLAMGIIFMIFICSFFGSTGYLLADTWNVMRDRWPEYRMHCRKPYAEMGLRSIGRSAEIATKFLVYFTLVGTAIVYLLLSSRVFHNLLANMNVNISFCWIIIIVAVLILPITFLKSPADFWLAIVIAVGCTAVAIILIFIGVSLDLHDCYPEAKYNPISFNAVLSLGIFLFAFNGHQIFPTVQNDMHTPPDFKKSVLLGFSLVALLYMPLSIYSFIVYGSSMSSSVIDSVQTAWIRYVANLAIAIHCILTIIITVNPINLQMEETFRIPHRFCFKRVLTRTLLMAFILFIGLSIPNFSSVMDLFGSTTIPCTCIILPSLFNIYIHAARFDENTKTWIKPTFFQVLQRSSKRLLAYLVTINIVTIICAAVSFYMSIKAIIDIHFTPPCYVIPFKRDYQNALQPDIMNCCGAYGNISRTPDFTCGAYF